MARGGVPAWIPYCHAGLITLKIDTTSAGKIGLVIKVYKGYLSDFYGLP